jgi:xanthine dehydrogenase YagR molybdenum-binding subunit
VRAAAQEVKRQLLEIAAAELERPASTLVLREGRVASREEPGKEVALSELRGLAARRAFVGVGERKADPPGRMLCSFAVHFAEVEVNVLTGEVRVLRLLGAHDSGRVMNLLTYRNQVFGGMTMGIGFGMSERRVLDRQTGRVLNANWHDYKIPTALDVPADMTCLPIDPQDKECNAVGAKGLGEPATIPTAAAIANAVFHATGVRVTEMPLNPTRLATLLAEKRAKEG